MNRQETMATVEASAEASAMPARLCALAGGCTSGLESFRALFGDHVEWLDSPDDAVPLLAKEPSSVLLIAYPDPVLTAARALGDSAAAGEPDPLLAMPSWLSDLLALHRQNRRRIAMVNGDAALSDPAGLVLQLRRRHRLEVGLAPLGPGLDPPESGLVEVICVEAAIRRDPGMVDALAELEASSLPLSPPRAGTAEAVIEAWRTGSTRAWGAAGEGRDLAEENELLLLQLQQVQEMLESYAATNRELERQLGGGFADPNAPGSAGFDQYPVGSGGWYPHAMRLQKDLEAVHASLSWRITAPLRALARPFMEKKTD